MNSDKYTVALQKAFFFVFCPVLLGTYLFGRLIILDSHHWDIGGIENSVVYTVAKVLQGKPLYGDPEAGNYDITQYAPIYYHCMLLVARVAGLDPFNDLHALFITGRSLSLLFNLVGMGVVYRLLTVVLKADRRVAATASLLCLLTLTDWHFAARVDSLFFLTGTVVLYCFTASLAAVKERERRDFLVLGILAAATSTFVKQTGMQYAAIIPLFYLFKGRRRESLASAIGILAATAGMYLLFRSIHGPFFEKNVIGGVSNGVSIPLMLGFLAKFLIRNQVVSIAVAVSVMHRISMKKAPPYIDFLIFLPASLFAFAIVTSLKKGSALNYYTESLVAMIVLSAAMADRLLKSPVADRKLKRLVGTVVATQFLLLPSVIALDLEPRLRQHLPRTRRDYREKVWQKRKVADYLKSNLGPGEYFLSLDKHIEIMLADRAVVPNKEIIPSQVGYEYTGFQRAVEDGTIRYFVLDESSIRGGFMGIDFSSLKKKKEVGGFVILEKMH